MKRALLVIASALLDAAAGDPQSLPHPVRAIGRAAAYAEPRFRAAFPATPAGERIAGTAMTLAIVSATALAGTFAKRVAPVEIVAGASTLALRSLCEEASAVCDAAESGDIELARERLSRIVGRDTARLTESEIARATIETLAESTCDGVIAPLCGLALGGVPAAFAYKAINTLDSTIGHIEPPYRDFGWFAARLDDVANFVPARAAAACILAAAHLLENTASDCRRIWLRDARRHRSPNAGQTEAAMAGALGVRLGGANRYDGVLHEGARFGAEFRDPSTGDARRAIAVTVLAGTIAYACATLLALIADAA